MSPLLSDVSHYLNHSHSGFTPSLWRLTLFYQSIFWFHPFSLTSHTILIIHILDLPLLFDNVCHNINHPHSPLHPDNVCHPISPYPVHSPIHPDNVRHPIILHHILYIHHFTLTTSVILLPIPLAVTSAILSFHNLQLSHSPWRRVK